MRGEKTDKPMTPCFLCRQGLTVVKDGFAPWRNRSGASSAFDQLGVYHPVEFNTPEDIQGHIKQTS